MCSRVLAHRIERPGAGEGTEVATEENAEVENLFGKPVSTLRVLCHATIPGRG